MQNSIPMGMKAVVQAEAGGKLTVKEVPVPVPGKGEVLVKMAYAPVNPSDLSQLRGTFRPLPGFPFIPGIEGSGTVIASGGGLIPRIRLNKKVACSPSGKGGTWAEYMVTTATHTIPLVSGLSLEQGSMLIVNPVTVVALTDIIRKGGHTAVVNNAAASAVGRMLSQLCRKNKITLINIVRREDQVKELSEKGEKFVLNSSSGGYLDKLEELTTGLVATLFLDAVGGEATGQFVKVSPPGSRIILYANLSGENFSADPRSLLQYGKNIDGFSLPLYLAGKSIPALLSLTSRAGKLLVSSGGVDIREQYPIERVNDAIETYSASMSGGKVLIKL